MLKLQKMSLLKRTCITKVATMCSTFGGRTKKEYFFGKSSDDLSPCYFSYYQGNVFLKVKYPNCSYHHLLKILFSGFFKWNRWCGKVHLIKIIFRDDEILEFFFISGAQPKITHNHQNDCLKVSSCKRTTFLESHRMHG